MTRPFHPLTTSVPDTHFVGALRASHLLSEELMDQVERDESDAGPDGHALAQRLVAEGLLTAYQAERLLAGRPEGLVLGHYRVLDHLGTGGMGSVYRAEHVLLQRRVALKVLAEHLVLDEEAVRRFRWEVQVAAQLQHPNIVAVHDAGECNGLHFLVMEYVDGVDLGRFVREQGPLDVPLACECIRQVAMGLQHAYAAGFVHCDVKPSNFLLTRNTELGVSHEWTAASPYFTPHSEYRMVKIVDLGLARRLGMPGTARTLTAQETTAEDLAGSADYLAPEQARDPRQVDVRSDLYGLGCTFYFLLTGQAPFPGGAWPDKLLRHQLDQPTPVRSLRADVPEEIEAVIGRLMCKEPAERYALPADVAVVLHEWLAGRRQAATAVGKPFASAPKTSAGFSLNTTPILNGHSTRERPRAPLATVAVEQNVPPGPHTSNRWGMLLGLAAMLGVIVAGILHYSSPRSDSVAAPPSGETTRAGPHLTVASRPGVTFTNLPAAVQAAGDGDTITLHGEGPFATPPLVVRGKSLHLKAAQAARACLHPLRPTAAWQPLLTVDRPLKLEGVELHGPPAGATSAARTGFHLIYAEGAAIQLVNCRLLSSTNSGLIVVRHGSEVVLERCELTGRGSSVVVEVGAAPVVVRISDSHLQTADPDGAALTIWAPAAAGAEQVQVELNRTRIQAGRVAAFTGLPRAVELTMRGNRLTFREALLSFADCATPETWRQVTRWRGQDNRYQAAADWLRVEGQSHDVRGLDQWRDLWRDAEPGSSEEMSLAAGL